MRKPIEGEEFEGELEDGERVWLEPSEQARIWVEEAEIMALEAEDAGEGPEAIVACDEAIAEGRRMAKLKETLVSLRGLGAPAAVNLVNQQIVQMEKTARCGGREDQVQARVRLRAFVRRGMDAEIKTLKSSAEGCRSQTTPRCESKCKEENGKQEEEDDYKGEGRP